MQRKGFSDKVRFTYWELVGRIARCRESALYFLVTGQYRYNREEISMLLLKLVMPKIGQERWI